MAITISVGMDISPMDMELSFPHSAGLTQRGLYSSVAPSDVHLWARPVPLAAANGRARSRAAPLLLPPALLLPLAKSLPPPAHGPPDRAPPSRLPGCPPSRQRRAAISFS